MTCNEKKQRNLKCMFLNERSRSEKATHYMIPTACYSGKGKLERCEKDQWLPGACWGRMRR